MSSVIKFVHKIVLQSLKFVTKNVVFFLNIAYNRHILDRIERKGCDCLVRFLMTDLVKWKNSPNRKPLLIKGARQVGKTWLMKEFGRLHFSKVAYINFDNNPKMKNVFEEDYNIDRILMAVNIEAKLSVTPNDTLIIFDEIQEAPKAIASLKYFCENAPEYAIVVAGSLLGVAIHEGVSFPVGKVDLLELHPLNYLEFLEAMGEKELADLIKSGSYELMTAFKSNLIHWLKNYYYTGGMPEAVQYFAIHKDYAAVRKIQNTIIEMYESDFSKHTPADELPRLRMVWNSIPMQLAKENKKFFFGQILKGGRLKDFELAIEWLSDCGLIKKVYRISKPAVPLKAYVEFSAFKLFLLDIGLLGALSDLDAQSILSGNDIFTEFKGALTEQYVHQQLISSTEYIPYYFAPQNSSMEIDFLVRKGSNIVPIEVKAEENLRAKSLKSFCDKYKPEYAVRTSMSDYRKQDWMTNIPLYAVCNL